MNDTEHMGNRGKRIGDINGLWQFIFKAALASYPAMLALMAWLISETFENRAFRKSSDRFTKEDAAHLEMRIQENISKMPPQDWRDRIMKLESKISEANDRTIRIEEIVKEIRRTEPGMDILNDLINSVGNLGTGALIVLGVIATGYVIKALPWISNGTIPLFTLATAVVLNVLIGDVSAIDYKCRNPQVRLGMIGLVYWCIGWLLHNQGLRRFEKFLPGPLKALIGADDEKPTEPKP